MPWKRMRTCLIACLLLLLGASQASATEFCLVQKSPDGYVALRAKPSAELRFDPSTFMPEGKATTTSPP